MNRPPLLKYTLLQGSVAGVMLCAVVSLALWRFPSLRSHYEDQGQPLPHALEWAVKLGEHLTLLSYDLGYIAREPTTPKDLVLVYLDENTYDHLHQKPESFDRKYHAQLLNKLTADRARVVAFDILWREESNRESDDALAEAIRRNPHVIMVSDSVTDLRPNIEVGSIQKLPLQKFLDAGGSHGLSLVVRDENYVARGFYHGTPEHRGFVWEAARIAGSHYVLENPVPNNELWLNYYGGPSALRSMSFEEALNQDPGFFKEKLVFVGRKPITDFPGREVDQFGTPYARFQGRNANVGGVYIAATAFMNLMQGTPLQRMSTEDELRLLLYGALLFGGGLVWLRPWWAAGAGLACFFAAGAISCTSVWQTHTWWAWMFVSGVQIPVALAWALFTHTRRLGREKAYLEKTLTQTLREVADSRRSLESAPQPAGPAKPSLFDAADADKTPTVADHTLVRRVGKGGYGEVWLARNAIGMHHVVKVVYREGFNDDGPYEREFRGIQKFMPISRSHPGFVNILQVGRNDRAGCFYYVMEAGDDEKTGQLIDPATYAPKTLGSVLRDGGALAPRDSVLLGMALASALGSLHQQKLIHRDIKPANIIYLNGAPKLADIGLVTDIETTGRDVSLLGTEGYIAPEGPGTPAADVYSLGKVLYEASTGIDRRRFPELPTALYDASDAAERLQLNRIVLRACEPDPADRYATAAEMKADLEDLATRMGILPGGGPPQPGPG